MGKLLLSGKNEVKEELTEHIFSKGWTDARKILTKYLCNYNRICY